VIVEFGARFPTAFGVKAKALDTEMERLVAPEEVTAEPEPAIAGSTGDGVRIAEANRAVSTTAITATAATKVR